MRRISSRGSSSSAAQTTESTSVSPVCSAALSGVRYGTTSLPSPRVHEDASTTSGSLPPAVHPQAASTMRLAMTTLPRRYPLECQRVAQQVPATSDGIHTGRPARCDTATTASGSDGPRYPVGSPKIRFTHAG